MGGAILSVPVTFLIQDMGIPVLGYSSDRTRISLWMSSSPVLALITRGLAGISIRGSPLTLSAWIIWLGCAGRMGLFARAVHIPAGGLWPMAGTSVLLAVPGRLSRQGRFSIGAGHR